MIAPAPSPVPFAFGPGSALARIIRVHDLLAHSADEVLRASVTILGALNIAAARLDAPASLVELALAACECEADLAGYPAHDRIVGAWKRLRRAN